MNTQTFKRRAISTAVSAVLTAGLTGVANSAELLPLAVSSAPTLDGVPFVPALNAQMDASGTFAAAATGTVTMEVIYLNDSDVETNVATVDDANNDASLDGMITGGDTTNATKAVVVLVGAADTFGGAAAAFVRPDGTVSGGHADRNAARDAAIADANADWVLNADYQGNGLIAAFRDMDTNATEVFLEFFADPRRVNGTAFVPGDQFTFAADDPLDAAALEFTGANVASDVKAVNGNVITLEANGGGAFADTPETAKTNGADSTDLSDGAGNGVRITLQTIQTLEAPGYATTNTGAVAIATTGSPDDAYGDVGVGAVSLFVRMGAEVDVASFAGDGFDDLNLLVGGTNVAVPDGTEVGLVADADGQNTILEATLNADLGGGERFFLDGASGNLTHGVDRESAVDVQVQVIGNTANGLALAFSPTTKREDGDDTTPTQVRAGSVQAPQLATRDSNQDGWIDGGTLNFRQDLSAIDQNKIRLVGCNNANADNLFEPLGGSVTPDGNNKALLGLATPDTPDANGDAPATAQNDYDGSGTLDGDDAALVIASKFNTAQNATSCDAALVGVPFQAQIGEYVTENNVTTFSPDGTGLSYARAFNSQTGAQLAVTAEEELGFSADGARPVVQSVEFRLTDLAAPPYDDTGDVVIVASEDLDAAFPIGHPTDGLNEFLFDGVPSDLINFGADLENRATIAIAGNEITIGNMPNIIGQTLSLGVTGGAIDEAYPAGCAVTGNFEDLAPCNKLLIGTGGDPVVAEGAAGAPEVLDVTFADIPFGELEDSVVQDTANFGALLVKFDQDVFPPAGQTAADRDGMFVVRARIGFNRDGAADGDNTENERADDPTVIQMVIPGANVHMGTEPSNLAGDGLVTLTIPGGLPNDTTAIGVDYQGLTEAEIDDGEGLRYVQNSSGTPAKTDGTQIFDDALGAEVAIQATFNDAVNDEDTAIVDPIDGPFFSGGEDDEDNRELFTQAVRGTITVGGETVADGTGVRVDVVKWSSFSTNGGIGNNAVLKDGYIDVQQGHNSEFVASGDDGGDNLGGRDYVTVALKNDAYKAKDLDEMVSAASKVAQARWALAEAAANNRDTSKQSAALDKARADAINKYGRDFEDDIEWDESNGVLTYFYLEDWAYVKLTTGSGKDAQDGGAGENSGDFNGNASYGRTATLMKNVVNKQENGTTVVPVMVWFEYDLDLNNDGSLDDVDSEIGIFQVGGDPIVRNGALHHVMPTLSHEGGEVAQWVVMDTSYALTKDGAFRTVVGVDEDLLQGDRNPSGQLDPELDADEACILVSVRNSWDRDEGGNYILTNSCEPSFTSYRPFMPLITGDTPAPTTLNVEMDNIAVVDVYDDGDWNLLGVPGHMDRLADSGPLMLDKFFLQIRRNDGAPLTLWAGDGESGDAVATMGLAPAGEEGGALAGNTMQLAFQLGNATDNAEYGEVNPAGHAALLFRGDGENFYSNRTDAPPSNQDTREWMDDDHGTGNLRLFVPTRDGGPVNLGPGWHAVSAGAGQTMAGLVADNPNAQAIILFRNEPNAAGDGDETGRDSDQHELDQDVDNHIWFPGDTASETPFGGPTGAIINVNADSPFDG